ncbi:MAG: extracellular solute-binding protein, partial [Acetatifactor sp.]|nr:extracellular solute-binding protein [Acetatifactor sp.]
DMLGQCLISPDGELIYGKNGRLLRWNVVQGTCESLYDGKNLNFMNCDGILKGAEGEVFAVFCQDEETFLYGFTDRETEAVVIRLELLTWGDEYIETCASEYTRRHPGVVIEILERQEDTELQLSRTMAQISQGEGPELMLVRRQQLLALQKEDVLAELSEVLPASEQEQIFPGVLANGRVGEGLYGITCGATFSTLLVSDQLWQGAAWSLEDVMGILEERERSGNLVEQFSDIFYKGEQADITLYELVLANIGRSSLVDLQAGKCYFDTEKFCRVLEFCRRCEETVQNNPGYTGEEMAQRFREGEILTCRLEGNLIDFSRALARLGEGVHPVGYPTDGGAGSLVMTYDGCVAVNVHAGHREIVDDFLRFLVDYKSQQQYSHNWVRMDVLKDSVEERVERYDSPTLMPVFRMGKRSVIVLEGKKDGTSYLTEFLKMAGDSVLYETELDMIR